jgi:hypothetical protein
MYKFRKDKRLGGNVSLAVKRLNTMLYLWSKRVPIRMRLAIVVAVIIVFFVASIVNLFTAYNGTASRLPQNESIRLHQLPNDSTTIRYEEAKMYKLFTDSLKVKR